MKSPELWNWQPLGTFSHLSSAVPSIVGFHIPSFSSTPLSFSSICSSLPCCLGGQTEHMRGLFLPISQLLIRLKPPVPPPSGPFSKAPSSRRPEVWCPPTATNLPPPTSATPLATITTQPANNNPTASSSALKEMGLHLHGQRQTCLLTGHICYPVLLDWLPMTWKCYRGHFLRQWQTRTAVFTLIAKQNKQNCMQGLLRWLTCSQTPVSPHTLCRQTGWARSCHVGLLTDY